MKTRNLLKLVNCLFVLLFFVSTVAYAQSPQAIPYQALARDNAGNPVMNRSVVVRISIREATTSGTVLYKEKQSVMTNSYGLFNLNIGQGSAITGNFASIDWSSAAKFVEVEIDLNGGSAFVIMGTQQLMSVPYALYSGSSWNLKGNSKADTSFYLGIKDTVLPLKLKVNNEVVGFADGVKRNAGWGTGVLRSNTTGSSNSATGFNSLYSNSSGFCNTANGTQALYSNSSGHYNTSTGYQSLYSNTNGFYNTAYGESSLYSNISGNYNTAAGGKSLYSNTTGNDNTANGYMSIYSNTNGSNNTAYGCYSLYSSIGGNSNTAIGHQSLYLTTSGHRNTATGKNSLFNNTTGFNNTAAGYNSLYSNTTGYGNTANGNLSLQGNTTGYFNTASGENSMFSNTSGTYNTSNGYSSLYNNTTGIINTATGSNSLYNNINGHSNTATGYNSLYSNTTGTVNTATGTAALSSNSSGNYNTATGGNSLISNTIGSSNTAAGYGSLGSNTTGNLNTAIGVNSLFNNQTGESNTASGTNSLYSNNTGNYNTAIGYGSLLTNSSGWYNAALGNNAGSDNTTASYNTYVGHASKGGNNSNVTVLGFNATAAISNCIILGNNVNAGIGTSSPSLARLQVQGAEGNTVAYFSQSTKSRGISLVSDFPGVFFNCYSNGGIKSMAESGFPSTINADQSGGGLTFGTTDVANTSSDVTVTCPERMRITGSGRVGIGTNSPSGLLELGLDQGRKPSTSTWTISSDARLKNIDGPYTKGLNEILQLRPVLYHYRNTTEHHFSNEVLNTQSIGFVAQEVQQIFPECINKDDNGFLNLNIHAILVAYTNAIKEQQDEIEALRKENESIKQTISKILEKLNPGETKQK